ncbi:MAG: diacylglycerol kinase family protein [Candidatus Saccharimonas sp.]
MKYSTIAIIYNPNSTGSGKTLATELKKDLALRMPKQTVELLKTTHAGHGEEIAYRLAKKHTNPLIISASGDGGYHEVINGALKAQHEGAKPITGLLPAGNANDHYHNLHRTDTTDTIVNGTTRDIDVLTLEGVSKGKKLMRYAHSYIGFGITPKAGSELNKHKLNFFNQIWLVLRVLFTAKSVKLRIKGRTHHYDSVITGNVEKMSKVLKVSKSSRITDGKFEVTMFRRRTRLTLIGLLLHASLLGAKEDMRVSTFSLRTVRATLVQADGEISQLDSDTNVMIGIEKQALRCIV